MIIKKGMVWLIKENNIKEYEEIKEKTKIRTSLEIAACLIALIKLDRSYFLKDTERRNHAYKQMRKRAHQWWDIRNIKDQQCNIAGLLQLLLYELKYINSSFLNITIINILCQIIKKVNIISKKCRISDGELPIT